MGPIEAFSGKLRSYTILLLKDKRLDKAVLRKSTRLLKKLLTHVKFFTILYTIESAQEDAYSNSVFHNT